MIATRHGAWLPRLFALAAWYACCGTTAPVAAATPAPTPDRPNVVVLSLDTLSRDALRAYSPAAQSLPTLDALAAESLVFTRAVSTAAWTLPAHASLFTGLYPDRHGATDERVGLRPQTPVLAELLAAAGYETVAFTDEGYVGAYFGFARGFGRFNDQVAQPVAAVPVPRDGKPGALFGDDPFDRGIAYLQQRPRAVSRPPLFLFLHTYAIHEYFRVGPWAAAEGPAPAVTAERNLQCLVERPGCTAAEWDGLRQLYALEVRRMDAALRGLLATLDAALAGEPTLLVLLSDHGEGFSPATGVVHHGGNLDPEVVRIPLLVRGTGIGKGRNDVPISLVDLVPTLLELTGAVAPAGLDGRSLAAQWKGERRDRRLADRTLLAFEHRFWWEAGHRKSTAGIRAAPLSAAVAASGRWYVGDGRGDRLLAFEPLGPRRELAGESRLREGSREVIRARRRLEVPRVPFVLTPEVERELRALGYL